MKSIELAWDNVEVGQYVTVLAWKPREVDISSQDRSYVGDALQVKAIDLPFVVCEVLKLSTKAQPCIAILNLQGLTLKVLTKEYVVAASVSTR